MGDQARREQVDTKVESMQDHTQSSDIEVRIGRAEGFYPRLRERVSDWLGEALLTLSQYHVPELHLQYIFKQGLGLSISPDLYVGVYFDWGGERSALQQNHYASLAQLAGFPYPRFIHQKNIHAIPDETLQNQLKSALAALQLHYENRQFTGGFTFVIQPLTQNFWRQARLSRALREYVID